MKQKGPAGRPTKQRRAELAPLVVAAWQREDRPSVTAISRELGLGVNGSLVRAVLREAGMEPIRRNPDTRTAQHGDPGMWQTRKCRCEICDAARREYRREREWTALAEEEQATALAELVATRARLQDQSKRSAVRSGHLWTQAEMQVVAREDLTAVQAARAIGRTHHAVTHARGALRDPQHRDHARYAEVLAGTATEPAPTTSRAPRRGGRMPAARRAELGPLAVQAWESTQWPSIGWVARQLGIGYPLARALLREAGIDTSRVGRQRRPTPGQGPVVERRELTTAEQQTLQEITAARGAVLEHQRAMEEAAVHRDALVAQAWAAGLPQWALDDIGIPKSRRSAALQRHQERTVVSAKD